MLRKKAFMAPYLVEEKDYAAQYSDAADLPIKGKRLVVGFYSGWAYKNK